MIKAEEQVHLTLQQVHRATNARHEMERADATVMVELLAAPDLVDENRAVYASM